jgi:hypothetical protein
VTKIKDVFDISKWHKSTGTYRSPPLKDPQYPDAPPAVSPSDKRTILINNLLQNTAEVGDIPLSCPTAPTTTLPFPKITETDTKEAIYSAGNTTSGVDRIPTCILKTAWPLIKDIVVTLF